MAWTYSGNPASTPKDAVRFLIRDTVNTRPLLQDEEIAWALSECGGNVYLAGALCCETLAGSAGASTGGQVTSKKVGDLALSYASGAETATYWLGLAANLRRRAGRKALPYAGGISREGKRAQEEDSDRVPPAFTKDLHTVPGGEIEPDGS